MLVQLFYKDNQLFVENPRLLKGIMTYLYRPLNGGKVLMLQLTKPLAFIDLETTGTNLETDRIVEIAIVKILPDGNRSVKRKLLNPGIPISKNSSDVHGITDEMVKDAPTFRQVAHELKQILDGCDFGGYNSNRFDIPLLVEEFLRSGVEFDMKSRRLVDVQHIFHRMEQRTL